MGIFLSAAHHAAAISCATLARTPFVSSCTVFSFSIGFIVQGAPVTEDEGESEADSEAALSRADPIGALRVSTLASLQSSMLHRGAIPGSGAGTGQCITHLAACVPACVPALSTFREQAALALR